MKHLGGWFLVLAIVSPIAAAETTLSQARERWLKGNYEQAQSMYEELAKDPKQRDAAALGLGKCLQSLGRYDEAYAAIDGALKENPKNADLHARKAELLHYRGRWDEAEKTAELAIALKKDQFLARWVRAQLYRDRGDLKKADAEFRWFVRTYTDRSDADNDIKDPDELLIVGLAGCENARWNSLSDQFEFILKDVWGDALKYDKNFWPARYQSGMLLLEKHNPGDAASAFEKALAINPRAAEVYIGKGTAALQKFDIKDAEQFAERSLKDNIYLYEGLLLRADVHLALGHTAKAMKELGQAIKVNPRDEHGLARVATCLFLERKQAEFDKLILEVEKHDPKPGVFYAVLGERIEERRRFDDAEKFFKKAIELRPMLPGPHNSLGLLYMRMGREQEARVILKKAFDADEFNVRVSNTLKVLNHLDKYETVKTAHFELRFDAKTDKLLAEHVARYLETIYEDLAERFQYRPKGPFLVEVFSNHEMFSGRIINLPDLHTIGACTGRMMAFVSPRGEGIRKPFNWVRVLRHELVHIFNLDQTHFLVPHWYTEGLAVISEGFPRPQDWNQLLIERVPKNELMNLDNIDLGFIRPKSALDWHMAYCQSQLYVEFMRDTYGKETIGGLLAAYAEGLDTEAAIQKVCKVDKATFEKGYRAYLDTLVRKLKGRPTERTLSFVEVRKAHEENPEDLDMTARLAEMYLLRDKAQARKLAETVLAKKKNHAIASFVKARLLRAAGDDEQALQLLESALDGKNPEPRVLQALGKMYFDAAQFAKAAEIFERAHQAEPHDARWLNELARIYAQTGDKDKHIQVLKDLVPTDADDIAVRKQTARMLSDTGKHDQAERYARQALEIDVLDPEAELLLGAALLGQKRYAEAVEVCTLAVGLFEKEKAGDKLNDARIKLAAGYLGAGQKDKARNEVEKVLAKDEDHKEARELKVQLEKK